MPISQSILPDGCRDILISEQASESSVTVSQQTLDDVELYKFEDVLSDLEEEVIRIVWNKFIALISI